MKISKTVFTAAVLGLVLSACSGGGEVPPTAFPGMTVDGTSAYLASNLHVYKFDANTATEAWRFPPTDAVATRDQALPGPFSGKPLKVGDIIVVGDSTGRVSGHSLYGLKESDGNMAWRFTQGKKEYTDGVVTDGKLIYAPNGDGTLYAIDPNQKDGSEPHLVWSFPTQNKLWTRPLVENGVVYQASLDHHLYAINAATGKEIWNFLADAPIAVQPVLVDGILYFGSFNSKFYAIKAADKSKVWEQDVDGWIWCNALVEDGTIYVGNVRGAIFALNQADGKIKWKADVADTVHAQPVRQGDKLFVMSMNTYAYVINLKATPENGVMKAEIFNDKMARRLLSTPIIHDSNLLVPLFDGDVKVARINLESKVNESFFPVPVKK